MAGKQILINHYLKSNWTVEYIMGRGGRHPFLDVFQWKLDNKDALIWIPSCNRVLHLMAQMASSTSIQ